MVINEKYKMHVEETLRKFCIKVVIQNMMRSNSNSMQIVHSNMQEGQHSNRGMVINVYLLVNMISGTSRTDNCMELP